MPPGTDSRHRGVEMGWKGILRGCTGSRKAGSAIWLGRVPREWNTGTDRFLRDVFLSR